MRETRRIPWAAPRRLAVLGAVALAGVAAAGCGGSGDASTAAADGDPRERFREAALEYAQCMRNEGVDMPDPEVNGGAVLMRRRAGDPDREDPAFEKADEKCREVLESVRPPEMSEEQRKEFQEAALEFAKCMRGEGIDMPDPQLDGDGRVQMRMGGGDGFDPSDPAFREAQEECRDELPMGGPGGPGPGGPGPGGP